MKDCWIVSKLTADSWIPQTKTFGIINFALRLKTEETLTPVHSRNEPSGSQELSACPWGVFLFSRLNRSDVLKQMWADSGSRCRIAQTVPCFIFINMLRSWRFLAKCVAHACRWQERECKDQLLSPAPKPSVGQCGAFWTQAGLML